MTMDLRRLGGHIIDETVDVSDAPFVYAAFTRCTVTRRKDAARMTGCHFIDCTFVGEGWPSRLRTTPPRRVEINDCGEGAQPSNESPPPRRRLSLSGLLRRAG